ncbi:hypothetical protein VPHD249_0207 [Vibrio phage D249]
MWITQYGTYRSFLGTIRYLLTEKSTVYPYRVTTVYPQGTPFLNAILWITLVGTKIAETKSQIYLCDLCHGIAVLQS